MSSHKFLQGTMILIGASFITKVLGFVYRIALSKIIGDEGMGLFQMAFPILIFALVITTAGIPVAISKLVSEAIAKKESRQIRYIIIVSTTIIIFTSIVVTGLIIIFAPFIANYLLTDQRAIYSLLGIAPIIPIIAVSSVFRGYFQGVQMMSPYAISTILEQIVRIFTVLILAQHLLTYGIKYAAAGAMMGMVLGEFVGMLYLIISYRRKKRRQPIVLSSSSQDEPWWTTIKQTTLNVLKITIPVTTSKVASSLSYAIEPIIVAQSLALAGIPAALSTSLYGQLEGMAVPIIYFPAFITYSLSISLIPAISEAMTQKNLNKVARLTQQTIRLCILIGSPCAILIFILAEPLANILYQNSSVANLLKIMAPYAAFVYLQGPLNSILQGMDQAKTAMHHSILGAIIKIALVFVLASRPSLHIYGVALAFSAGTIISTSLNMISIAKSSIFTINIREIAKTIIAMFLMFLTARWLITSDYSLSNLFVTTVGSLSTYIAMLFALALVTKKEFSQLLKMSKMWVKK